MKDTICSLELEITIRRVINDYRQTFADCNKEDIKIALNKLMENYK